MDKGTFGEFSVFIHIYDTVKNGIVDEPMVTYGAYKEGRVAGYPILLLGVSMICLNGLQGHAQFYTTGEDPSAVKWNQINSDHFQVIFPREFSSEARRATGLLEFYYPYNSEGLAHSPGRIPVVLHNRSVLSNGYVAWAPRRMELVTTPPADNYPGDYLSQLILHEFRHVVQVDKLDQGMTRILHYLAGQQAFGVAGLMPFWFIEGDAVVAETSLSLSGRGRLPSFEMEMKAILAETGEIPFYEKAYFGSYREHIPDYYQLGYQMVSHGTKTYGQELWGKMIDHTARKPYLLYPFYFGLKKHTGLGKSGLYRETFRTLSDHWAGQSCRREHTALTPVNNTDKRSYTSYRFPRYVNDSIIFAEKSGIAQVNEFVLIDRTGKEQCIHIPGFYRPASISVEGNRIAWTEVITDLRWGRRSYSVVKILEIGQKGERVLTSRTRYHSPDLTSDGSRVVVVQTDTRNRYALIILDAFQGRVLDSIPAPGNRFIQYPAWSAGEQELYVILQSDSGECIMKHDLRTAEWQQLFFSGFEDIAELSASEHFLVFRGTFSGIDNIYALDLGDNTVYRVTSSRFGAFDPELSPDERHIVYADYSSRGFNVVRAGFDRTSWVRLEDLPENREQLDLTSFSEASSVPVFRDTMNTGWDVRPFRKSTDLFQFHSWSPFYFDYSNPELDGPGVSPGFSLLSQNKLGTAVTILGYEYAGGEHYLRGSFLYTGFFPVFRIGIEYGGKPFVEDPPGNRELPGTVPDDLKYRFMVHLPLNMTRGKMVTGMKPSAELSHSRSYFFYPLQQGYKRGMTFAEYRIYAYRYMKTSLRDILPRWGGIADVRYAGTPFEREQIGSILSLEGILYLPGIFAHHALQGRLSYQKQDPLRYVLGNLIPMPRGVQQERMLDMRKLSLDYVFPVAYPDFRIWRLAYFKRIRAGLFYDHAWGENDRLIWRVFRSAGFDLTTDAHLLQVLFPVNTGIRLTYFPGRNKLSPGLLFRMDLNRF